MNKVTVITSRFDITNKQLSAFRNLLPIFAKDNHTFIIGGDEADYDIYLALLASGFPVEVYPHVGNSKDTDKYNGAKVINSALPLRDRNKRMVDEGTILIGLPQTFNELEDSPAWKTIRYAMSSEKEVYVISPNGYSWGLE
jgi:hypothetical protein